MDLTIPMRYWGMGIGGIGRYCYWRWYWYWYWYWLVLVLVFVGLDIDLYWYWSVLVLVLVLVFRHIFFKCFFSAKIIPASKTLKKAYLTPPLSLVENSEETSFLGLQTINSTLHLHTKKALFSGDAAFQQNSINGFRGRGFGTNRQIWEIMEKFCYFRNI